MNVFDRVTEKFFGLLSGNSNYRLNADCLLEVYQIFENEISYKVSRDVVRDTIAAYLMTEGDDDDDNEYKGTSPNDRANAIIRNFYDAGWLAEETDSLTYEKQVIMTEPGIALAEFLIQLVAPTKEEYVKYIKDIYLRLQNPSVWNKYIYTDCLWPTYQDAKHLANSLKKLSTSIKSIIEKVVEEKTLENLMANIISYCEGSFIKEYSRLINESNIHIYRPFILKTLDDIMHNEELFGEAYYDCYYKEFYQTEGDEATKEQMAKDRVRAVYEATIRFLSYDYDRIISDIQNKINIYLHLAVGRARFLSSHDENTRGNVQESLKYLVRKFNEEGDSGTYDLFEMYTQEFIDAASLRFPGKQRVIRSSITTEVTEMTQEHIDAAARKMKESSYNPYTSEMMKEYVNVLMGDKEEISTAEFPMERKTDILAAVAAVAYAQSNGFDIKVNDDYVESNGFIIRNFSIAKKG